MSGDLVMAGDEANARAELTARLGQLRAEMTAAEWDLSTKLLRMWAARGGGEIRFRLDAEDREVFTPSVQTLVLEVWEMVRPAVANDPDGLVKVLLIFDAAAEEADRDAVAVEGIARASGMD
ncbi:hypothetical protein AB0J38_01735 [Streptomyces sp. NPDC050095]|uniref:hypothetical protein n=1 Tax=unclassified Streptomyces TaxID=2593676 RepID=UPI003440886C